MDDQDRARLDEADWDENFRTRLNEGAIDVSYLEELISKRYLGEDASCQLAYQVASKIIEEHKSPEL